MAIPWLDQIVADAQAGLAAAPGAQAYLTRRLVPEADWTRYQLGYLPVEYEVTAGSAFFLHWQKRALRKRLICPITSTLGFPIGLVTRALDQHDYETFYAVDRAVYAPLYGLGPAADALYTQQQVVLVEGIFDLFAVRAACPGLDHVVATLTAKLSRHGVQLLSRYVSRVICLYDMDDPGRNGVRSVQGWYERPDGVWVPGRPAPYETVAPVYPSHDPSEWVTTGVAPMATLLAPYAGAYAMLG